MSGVDAAALADKADVVRGVTFSKRDALAEPRDGYVPVLRAGNIQDTLLLNSGLVFVPPKIVSEKQRLKSGDIVMCTSSGSVEVVGKTAFVHDDWGGTFGAFCAVVRPKKNKCHPRYLFHYLQSPAFRSWTRNSSGINIKNIRKSELDAVQIPFPDMNQQRRIAAILDKADAIRRKREQALALADEFLKSVFLEMFGDPARNPKGWTKVALERHASIKIGFPFKSNQYSKEGVRLCRGANTLPGRLDWSDTRYWPGGEAASFDEYSLEIDDIILALDRPMISSGLKVARVSRNDTPAFLVQRVARLRGDSRARARFIYEAIRHPSFWNYCNPTETTIPHISPVELREYPLIKPDVDALDVFGKVAEAMDRKMARLQADLDLAQQLFASLSKRAFCGEL